MKLTFSQVTQWIPKPPIIPALLTLALLTGLYGCYLRVTHPTILTEKPVVIAQVSPSVKHEVKQEVQLESPKKVLKVYKESVKKSVKLPKEAINNASIKLTDTSVIKESEYPTQVNHVVDITTGETTTYVSELPKPWFQLENRGYASIDYGFKRNDTSPVVRLNVREDLLQVKGIHLGITGSVHSDGDYFVGAGGEYRW